MSDQTEQGGTVGVAEGPVFSKHARSGEGNGDGGVPLAADKAPENVAFLLSQVGAYAGARFAARLAEIDLQPSLFRVLNLVDAAEGRSQQEIAKAVQAPPSRMVGFVDELERRGLVERRA
ncbi:MAG TPA: MarR family transcriptional regulator, partial [Solirubrobacterales bacterium]